MEKRNLEIYNVITQRLLAIVHDDTGLPVFAGMVNHLEDSYTEPECFD